MGVFDRFERGLERAVNGAFAKVFRSEVQPVEIAGALRKEMDTNAAIMGADRTIAPNAFTVSLNPVDHDRLGEWQGALRDELIQAVRAHAEQQRYVFVGQVTVSVDRAEDLTTGLFRVHSQTSRGDAEQSSAGGSRPWGGSGGSPSGHGGYRPSTPEPARPVSPARVPAGGPAPEVPSLVNADPSNPPASAWASPKPSRPSPPAVTLEIDGATHTLGTAVTVIGRGSDADLVIDDAGCSRRHAELHVLDSVVRVVDLGSTNGTYLNGKKVHSAIVTDGSIVTVGRTKILVRVTSG